MTARTSPGAAREQTYVFVDLAGFAALTETHGDEAAADCAERLAACVTAALGPDARLVGTSGDAAFVVAPDPTPVWPS
jgi:class 3 adenylate cyclase